MPGEKSVDELRAWRRTATEGLAAAVERAPEATVPAYPTWAVRDLALHVVRIFGNARIVLCTGALERPQPELGVAREDAPSVLAARVRDALEETEQALQACWHEQVWTPVGVRGPAFWHRRVLREAVLHRWDAEQAAGAASAPEPRPALELVNEFFDTDVPRALSGETAARWSGMVTVRCDGHRWTVDFGARSVTADAADERAGATISGEPAAVWLWLMGRDHVPGTVQMTDEEAGAGALADLIRSLNRPKA